MTTTAPTPRQRITRTAKQVLIAVPVAWGCITAPLEAADVAVSPVATALIVGVSGAVVVLISAVQNSRDESAGRG